MVTEISKIAVSFHSETHNALVTHSCRATAGINVKAVLQRAGKDPEQDPVRMFC